MKTITFVVLTLSLLLNATFAWLYVQGRKSISAPIPLAARVTAAPLPTEPRIDAEVWPALRTEELRDMVGRLRATGFPPDIVRAIVAAQLRESFAARRKAAAGTAENVPFWQHQQRDPRISAALRQIDREEQTALRELLGDTEPDDPLVRLNLNRGLDFLPADKAVEIRQIVREYDERRADLYAAGFGSLADRDKIEALEKEQQAAIARTLTPEEFFEYNLRRSRTANSLREELSAFNPGEEEFRTIFGLRAEFDERFGQNFTPVMSSEEMRRRSDAQKQLTEQIKAVLAPARAAEYERMTDFNYRRTSQLVARLELPPETTDRLHAVQKEFEQRRMDLYRAAGGSADRAQITEQLSALQQEANAKVAPLLGGARGVEAYKQHGGTWIANLVPRTPTSPPTRR